MNAYEGLLDQSVNNLDSFTPISRLRRRKEFRQNLIVIKFPSPARSPSPFSANEMGGYGSVGRNARGRGATAEAWRLNVNALKKAGPLTPGWYGGWQWLCDGEQVTNIRLRGLGHDVALTYKSRVYMAANGRVTANKWTYRGSPCRFGGQRPYFHCPACWRRVMQLYGVGRYLRRLVRISLIRHSASSRRTGPFVAPTAFAQLPGLAAESEENGSIEEYIGLHLKICQNMKAED